MQSYKIHPCINASQIQTSLHNPSVQTKVYKAVCLAKLIYLIKHRPHQTCNPSVCNKDDHLINLCKYAQIQLLCKANQTMTASVMLTTTVL